MTNGVKVSTAVRSGWGELYLKVFREGDKHLIFFLSINAIPFYRPPAGGLLGCT